MQIWEIGGLGVGEGEGEKYLQKNWWIISASPHRLHKLTRLRVRYHGENKILCQLSH